MKKYDNVLLVTGGAGFIGSAFLRMLVPKYPNWNFINLDALTYAGDLRKVESVRDYENYVFVHGNICDRHLVENLFEKYNINIVVNFAAESHVDKSIIDAEYFLETNIKGAYILLDTAKKNWKFDGTNKTEQSYRFIQISTDEVYGDLMLNDDSWTELSPIRPNSPYSASKASSELIAMSYYKTFGLPVIITRSSNNFGPFQNYEKLIPKIIKNTLSDLPIPIYGNGHNVRDWVFVNDNCAALEIVLLSGTNGEFYNIGGNNEHSNLNIANRIIGIIPESKARITFVEDRLGHDFRYSLDSSKLNRLGIVFNSDFDNNLKQTIEHYMEIFS